MAEHVLGIDYGSTMIKAGVYDLAGNEKSVSSGKCDSFSPQAGWYERDLDTVWQASKDAIAGALKKAGLSGGDIAAVSLTGHGNGAHLITADGKGARPAIEGADGRALEYVERWKKDGSFSKVHPMNLQAIFPAHTLCVMAWLRDHEPNSFKKAKWSLMPKDYIRLKLTGEAFLEYSDSTGSGLINTRDRKIDADMLDEAGLGFLAEKLPPLKYACDLCGQVTDAAAKETGLKAGTPVAAGCYDIDSAGLATGLTDESVMNVIVGSWANNQFISTTPIISEDFFSTTVYAIEGYYLMLEGSATGAINLEWFVDSFMGAEKAAAKTSGKNVYALCDEEVASIKPEASAALFLPFIYGSNVNPKAKGVFLGIDGSYSRKEIVRAVFEGICFTHRYHIEKLDTFKKTPSVARMSGGAVKSDVWRQMFADVLNKSMEVTGLSELGTLGAAMCAAVCAGFYKDLGEAAKKMVKVSGRTDPNSTLKKIYDDKYEKYKKALKFLDGYWS
jgi:L-xylulokinase